MKNDQICCPRFDPAPWDGKILEWKHKPFIHSRIGAFFNMPIGFGRKMRWLDRKIREAGAAIPDHLFLAYHTSPWRINIYVAVDREVPGVNNLTLSGRFFSKVYEGPFSETAKWCRDFEEKAKSKRLNIKKWYMWYTTCPKCAKKYGKNYVVILGEV